MIDHVVLKPVSKEKQYVVKIRYTKKKADGAVETAYRDENTDEEC